MTFFNWGHPRKSPKTTNCDRRSVELGDDLRVGRRAGRGVSIANLEEHRAQGTGPTGVGGALRVGLGTELLGLGRRLGRIPTGTRRRRGSEDAKRIPAR